VLDHRNRLESNGHLAERRSRQSLEWMNELLKLGLEASFQADRAVSALLPQLRDEVRRGHVTPFAASRELLRIFKAQPPGGQKN